MSGSRWRPVAIAATCLAASLGTCAAAVGAPAPQADGVIVGMSPNATAADRAEVRTALDGQRIERLGETDLYLVSRVTPTDVARAARDVRGLPQVDTVALDLPIHADSVPSDEYWSAQWGPQLIGLPAALDLLAVRRPVTVAVVDTGIDLAQPDLAANLWTNPGEIPSDGIDNDHNGYVDDVHGYDFANNDADPTDDADHGTHVAGIIGAGINNTIGVAGLASGARLMALKFMVPVGGRTSGTTANGVRALDYARANGAQVINNSWSGSTNDLASDSVCQAIASALAANIVVVNSAGNDAADLDARGAPPYVSPAQCAGPQITVAATTSSDLLWSPVSLGNPGSNYGAVSVDLGAPGQTIRSTVRGGYASNTGTSMAAPHVAGAAAMLLGEIPELAPSAVRAFLMNGGVSAPSLAGRTVSGRRLSLPGALTIATGTGVDTTSPTAVQLLTPGPGEIVAVSRPAFRWTASVDQSAVTYSLTIDRTVVARAISGVAATAPDPLADGGHTWSVEAVDAAGNATDSATGAFVISTASGTPPRTPDSMAPSTGSTARGFEARVAGGARATRSRRVRVTAALPDGATGMRAAESVAALRSAPRTAAGAVATLTLARPRTRADERTVVVGAYNASDALIATVTTAISLDQSAPVGSARRASLGGRSVLRINARDEHGPVSYRITGGSRWVVLRGSQVAAPVSGWVAGLRFRDALGNVGRVVAVR